MFVYLLLIVFDYVEEVGGVEPCDGEEVVLALLGEFLAETPQVDPQRVLSRDVVHTQEVVHSLPGEEGAEPLWRQTTVIEPVDVPRAVISFAFVSFCDNILDCRYCITSASTIFFNCPLLPLYRGCIPR